MPAADAGGARALRAFNYERIYVRPASLAQSRAVVEVLRALVSSTAALPRRCLRRSPGRASDSADAVRAAVTYVAGMTDRYAFDMAIRHLEWPTERLPRGIDRGA